MLKTGLSRGSFKIVSSFFYQLNLAQIGFHPPPHSPQEPESIHKYKVFKKKKKKKNRDSLSAYLPLVKASKQLNKSLASLEP